MKMSLPRCADLKPGRALAGAAMLICNMLTGVNAASDVATINITGRVLANSCTIDTSSAIQNVTLPDISARDLHGVGKTGGEKAISIVLNNCGEDIKGVVVTATGMADADDSSAFANFAANGAGGVGLYFYQTDGKTIFTPDGGINETNSLTASENNILTYKASYVSTRDEVRPGSFQSVVNLRFEYQ